MQTGTAGRLGSVKGEKPATLALYIYLGLSGGSVPHRPFCYIGVPSKSITWSPAVTSMVQAESVQCITVPHITESGSFKIRGLEPSFGYPPFLPVVIRWYIIVRGGKSFHDP